MFFIPPTAKAAVHNTCLTNSTSESRSAYIRSRIFYNALVSKAHSNNAKSIKKCSNTIWAMAKKNATSSVIATLVHNDVPINKSTRKAELLTVPFTSSKVLNSHVWNIPFVISFRTQVEVVAKVLRDLIVRKTLGSEIIWA